MKKRISLAMALIMLMSLIFSASAMAEDIIIPPKTLLEHDFTQDTATPEDWTVTTGASEGNWGYDNGAFITQTDKNLVLTSNNTYDTKGNTYSIIVNHSLMANYYYEYFAVQNNSQYYVEIAGGKAENRYVYLKKKTAAGTETLKTSEAPINSSIWADPNHNASAEIIIEVGEEALNVYVNEVLVLSYETSEGYLFDSSLTSGKIKLSSGYNRYKLYAVKVIQDMAVVAPANTGASVEFEVPSRQLLSHDFTQDTELPAGWSETKAEDMTGYTYDNGLYVTQTDRSYKITSDNTYDANGKPYTINVKQSLTYNQHKIHFAIQNSGSYLVNIKGSNADSRYVYLSRITKGEEETVATELAKSAEIVPSTIWTDVKNGGSVTVKITVGTGSIDVYINDKLYISYAHEYDSTVQSGKIAFESGYSAYRLYSFNMATEATTASINDFSLNKTFSSADTEADLEAKGWNVTLHNSTITADALPASSLSYNANISGNYTVEAMATKKFNNTEVYIRYDEATKNGYMARVRLASSQYISLGKVVNGTYQEEYKVSSLTGYDTTNTKYYVSVEDVEDDVKITLRLVNGGTDRTWSWTDEKSDENEPIKTAGKFIFTLDKYASPYVSYLKVYPTKTGAKNFEDVSVRYYIGNEVVEDFNTNGTAYINVPTAFLGETFVIVSALYDGGSLKEAKVVDVASAYELSGYELFDLSDASEDAYIATYIWTGAEMIPVKEASLLN